jgi:GH25 family lysozyme M1 (1,4-beta-N-acetylmuramidase)
MAVTFPGTQPGIDISKWQWGQPIDFQAVADFGVKFVIIRAGLGENYKDPYFVQSVEGFRGAGVKVGAYHVFDPFVSVSPEDQIEKFADIVDGLSIKLGRGDFELPWSGASTVQQLRDGVYRFSIAMSQVVSNTGKYTAPWWWNSAIGSRVMPKDPPSPDDPLIRANGWSLWNADYGANDGQLPARMAIVPVGWRPSDPGTGEHKGWEIWQFTSRGKIPGIQGSVDLNIMRDALFEEVWGEEPPPPPPPPPEEDKLDLILDKLDALAEAEGTFKLN